MLIILKIAYGVIYCANILRRQGISSNDFDLASCYWGHFKRSSPTELILEQNMHLFVISCCFILKHLIYFARASLTTIMWINHGLQYGEHMRHL